jgi:ferrous iron transport protein A
LRELPVRGTTLKVTFNVVPAVTNALPLSLEASIELVPARNGAVRVMLATALPGQRVRIVGIAQEEDLAAWLRAVGMHEDAEVTVLRRAPFGGPMHLRSRDGGEFAIHRALARCIEVVLAHDVPDPPDGSRA